MENNDLCELNDLDDDVILNILEKRYASGRIYTKSGLIFLALNPYENINSHDIKTLQPSSDYSGNVHVYDVAEASYQDLFVHGNQTIVISGESGSGKTENTKLVIKYLVERTASNASIERNIAAANAILEAFGNAQTVLNDNSSRFGKRIKLMFDGKITGARFETYLLEKSRVTHHEAGEKNFHIFYQFCAFKDFNLKNDFIDTSNLLGDRESTMRLSEEYEATCSAMKSIGITCIKEIEKCLLGILYLGSIQFSSDGILKVVRNECFTEFCKLHHIQEDVFEESLVRFSIKVKGETIEVFNTLKQAITIRNSMARLLYSNIFNYITTSINSCLSGSGEVSISVLDIFGFEVFENNGLDQLCINWTNEKIQSDFIRKVFREKQEMYKEEGIEWNDVEFFDNNQCILDFEKPCGLMDLISEESFNAWGNTKNLSMKIKNYLNGNIRTKADDRIIVSHYAGSVEYDLRSFLDKNREKGNLRIFKNDLIIDEESKEDLVKYFKDSMNRLLHSINETQAKYIKCIKPNAHKKPKVFDRLLVSKQLVECGILETIRVSKQCFPQEIRKDEFESRYKILEPTLFDMVNVKKGKTRYFMSNETLNILEARRLLFYAECFRNIKHALRGYLSGRGPDKKQSITFVSRDMNGDVPLTDHNSMELLVEGGEDIEELQDSKEDTEEQRSYKEIIRDLELKIEQYKRFCEAPCRNCKSLELKYRFQSEALKKKNMVELELEKYKAKVEDLERLLLEKEEDDDDSQMSVSFTNSYNVLSCLVQLYLEFVPTFSNEEVPRPEVLSLAHSAFYAVNKLGKDIVESSVCMMNEISLKLHMFERNIHKVSFILSNLIEYESILRGQGINNVSEVKNLVSVLFKHLCELQRSSLLEVLPYAVIEHQQLSKFKCNEGYLKKIFKPPHISKLIRLLEYFYHQMSYYYIPDTYIMESVNYLLKTINVSVFNEILVKKNFLSFNRGVQINYNINEIDKFCRSINYLEGMFNLSHTTSIIRLINLVESRATADLILDECSILNCVQINEIVSKLDAEASYFFGNDNRNDKFISDPTVTLPSYTAVSPHSFICPRYLPSESLLSILKSIR
ncbi:myosin heavy chain [Encephalitozoon hellem ATCC 50504]|uniref:Myosin heavy chain n=1 Tax=Encephalitozoon hellem TaxID=27973 RepID=A0A9Q9C6V6_ENCHE|nr:myosin heavy chain [Encephalitozoon hellem ATCC 50504]AFM99094.1 myosin heavy chain [Encephalitozoon hellem ATCC 50504]UTX42500.1 myosin heavy chain [Encephalitozoon hellem]|eukprot:XP_003888075.1 myosin heavy chain [Encephalitozoon hellem ATCC 50504]